MSETVSHMKLFLFFPRSSLAFAFYFLFFRWLYESYSGHSDHSEQSKERDSNLRRSHIAEKATVSSTRQQSLAIEHFRRGRQLFHSFSHKTGLKIWRAQIWFRLQTWGTEDGGSKKSLSFYSYRAFPSFPRSSPFIWSNFSCWFCSGLKGKKRE